MHMLQYLSGLRESDREREIHSYIHVATSYLVNIQSKNYTNLLL